MLLHAALFAAVATFTIGRPHLPAGNEVTPSVTFGLVVDEPPVAEPPQVEPPATPPEPAQPPPPVVEPAMPIPVDPLTSIAADAPVTMPARPAPTVRATSPLPPKKTSRPATGGMPASGDRGGDAGFTPAVCTYRANPDFPATARRERREGGVVLLVSLDARGRVMNVSIVTGSGHASLDAAAQSAARRCRFRPAMRGGVPVSTEVRVPYTFRLGR